MSTGSQGLTEQAGPSARITRHIACNGRFSASGGGGGACREVRTMVAWFLIAIASLLASSR